MCRNSSRSTHYTHVNRPRLRGKRLALALFAAQSMVGGTAGLAWYAAQSGRSGVAALYGALIAVVPGLYFALQLLWQPDDASPKRMARALYLGEFGKLALTAALFAGGAIWFGPQFVPLLTTYMACLACYWLAMVANY